MVRCGTGLIVFCFGIEVSMIGCGLEAVIGSALLVRLVMFANFELLAILNDSLNSWLKFKRCL